METIFLTLTMSHNFIDNTTVISTSVKRTGARTVVEIIPAFHLFWGEQVYEVEFEFEWI